MIDIKDILCALEVAKEKNLTKAASNLFLTQSAVSQKISRLEKNLGLTLFERNNRNVDLTEDGIFFIEHASTLIEEWDAFLEKMTYRRDKDTKFLTVGMHALAIYSDLPELIYKFTTAHPNWKVNISTHSNEANFLHSDDIDFFFLFSSFNPVENSTSLAQIPLKEDVLHIILHKTDALSEDDVVMSEKLTKYHLISWNVNLIHSFPKELNLTQTVCEDSFLPSLITRPGIFTLTPKSRSPKILQQYPDLCSIPFKFSGNVPSLTLYLLYNSNKINTKKHPFVQFVIDYYKNN